MLLHHKVYHHPTSTDWIAFVHGAGGSSSVWYKQVKAFRADYNVLLVDLRGHGASSGTDTPYSFEAITHDLVEVMNHLSIRNAHFVGISLGSLLISQLAILHPIRVKSLVLGGTILRLNLKSRTLLAIGNALKSVTPFIWLYQIFAGIILPRKNHAESRKLFINEAKKLNQREFIKWFGMTSSLPSLFQTIRNYDFAVPTILIQGDQDHMFIHDVTRFVQRKKNILLRVIQNCGHVVNIEAGEQFNQISMEFIRSIRSKKEVDYAV